MTDSKKAPTDYKTTTDSAGKLRTPNRQHVSDKSEDVDSPPPEPAPNSGGGHEDRVRDLAEEAEQFRQEARANYDRMLRATAELENYKKRAARETADFKKFANENLIKALLPVVDNLELAIQSSSQNEKLNSQVVEGVTLTLAELSRVLEGFGVKVVEAKGKPFDPNFHQAFLQEEASDVPENTVLKEFQKGYLLHDRLIRPAMVIVSKQNSAPAGSNGDGSDNSQV